VTSPTSLHTPDGIIRKALKDAGRLQTGDTPSGEVYSDALSRLGDLINTWQTQGLKLWLNVIRSITPVAGTATYLLGPSGTTVTVKPLRVVGGWYVASGGARRSLTPLSWESYCGLGNLTSQGAVNSYFVDKQRLNLSIKLWQVPDTTAATGTVELLCQEQATAPISLDETVAFPVEWYLALRWGLADDLATGQPQLIMDRCERKAREYRTALEDWDVEDASTFFQPNAMMLSARASRFR
jgi:hypothetical protein